VGGARGFTLIEVLIAVAVVAMVTAGAVGATMGARSLAVSTTAAHFDALLDAARTTAREFDGGVTIAFEPDAYGDGFTARLYGRRPSVGPLLVTDVPILDGRVTLTETELLGAPAFALALHANGKVGGIRGDVLSGSAGAENACPAAGMYTLVFTYGGVSAQRTIPCTITLAATGPVAYVSPPAASPLPPPTPNACIASGCLPTPPPEPTIVTTCPPGYTQTNPTTCTPATPTPAPTPTCPPGYTGTYPLCTPIGEATPTPTPPALAPWAIYESRSSHYDESLWVAAVAVDVYDGDAFVAESCAGTYSGTTFQEAVPKPITTIPALEALGIPGNVAALAWECAYTTTTLP